MPNKLFMYEFDPKTLAELEFKMNAQKDSTSFKNFYLQKKYNTKVKNRDWRGLFNSGITSYDPVIQRKDNLLIGNVILSELIDQDDDQKIATLANSYFESGGWNIPKQINGPATGYFMMEDATKRQFQDSLAKWGLPNNAASEAKFVNSIFKNKDKNLITPWDRINNSVLAKVNEYRKVNKQQPFKDTNDLKIWINNNPNQNKLPGWLKSIFVHKGYTTDKAWEDFNTGNLYDKVKGFEGLFERASKPELEKRNRIAEVLKEALKTGMLGTTDVVTKEDPVEIKYFWKPPVDFLEIKK